MYRLVVCSLCMDVSLGEKVGDTTAFFNPMGLYMMAAWIVILGCTSGILYFMFRGDSDGK